MLICRDCELVFDKPMISVEKHGLDSPPYETFEVCPHCRSTDIHEAHQCDACGEWIRDDYIETENGMRFCNDCYVRRSVDDD